MRQFKPPFRYPMGVVNHGTDVSNCFRLEPITQEKLRDICQTVKVVKIVEDFDTLTLHFEYDILAPRTISVSKFDTIPKVGWLYNTLNSGEETYTISMSRAETTWCVRKPT